MRVKSKYRMLFVDRNLTGPVKVNLKGPNSTQFSILVVIGRLLRVFPHAVPDVQLSKYPAPGVSPYYHRVTFLAEPSFGPFTGVACI